MVQLKFAKNNTVLCSIILMSDGMMNRPHDIIMSSDNSSDLSCLKKRRTRIIDYDLRVSINCWNK